MMNCLLVGLFAFPFGGGASASRLRGLALGLREAGHQVTVLSYRGEPGSDFAQAAIWRGVTCQNYCAAARHSDTGSFLKLLVRRVLGGRVRSREMRSILERAGNPAFLSQWDTAILYDQDPVFAWRFARICRRQGKAFIQHYCEMHLPSDYRDGWLSPIYLREQIHSWLAPGWTRGDIAISSLLAEGCSRGKSRGALVIPALSDTESPLRAPALPVPPGSPFTFTYLGAGERRDCLELALQVAQRLRGTHEGWRIRLAGVGKARLAWAQAQISQAGLTDRVEVMGWLTDAERDQVFSEAGAFFLLRTDDRSSRACFPTRLPEYLGTGRPVIVSRVGDIPRYLRDGTDALLPAPMHLPETVAAFARLLDCPGEATNLGADGRKAAQREFGYQVWGRRLAEYLEQCVRGANVSV